VKVFHNAVFLIISVIGAQYVMRKNHGVKTGKDTSVSYLKRVNNCYELDGGSAM
jgi:hypothetical protein